jgi:hypothetical protein
MKEKFSSNYVTAEEYLGNDDLFAFQSQVMFGAAVQRASMLHSSPYLITVYSEVDPIKQVGGTYDTIKFWPPDHKRININPQNYMTAPTMVQGGNDTTLQQWLHKPASQRPPARAPAGRSVRFLVCVGFQISDKEHQSRIDYQLNKKLHELGIGNIDRKENPMLFALKTIEEATLLAWGILKIQGFSSLARISLHAGLVSSGERGGIMSGPATTVVRAMNEFLVAGKVYASFQFASILALQGDGYAVEYAGIVSTGGDAISIFQVNRHADAFDLV